MKKIFLFSCLLLAFALGGCTSTDEGDMTIELACPKPVAKIKDNVATITWPAIAKTAGYAYRIGEGEYTQVADDVLSYSVKLANGSYIFHIYAVGNNTHTTDSAIRTIEFEVNYDATLPMPEPSASTNEQGTTISWKAVPKAVGYAYSVDGGNEVTVGAEILSYKAKFADESHTFAIRALGDGTDSKDSPVYTLEFDLIDTSIGVFVKKANGAIIELPATETGIHAKAIDCAASDSFTILIDNVEHGFLAYGGNGGVGTVNSIYAAVPFYNGYTYYVRESIGRLTKTPEVEVGKLNALYTNLSTASSVYVKIDRSNPDRIPRYYLNLEQAVDASILLAQYFDRMLFGGDWTYPGKLATSGTTLPSDDPTTLDGTEPGTPKDVSYTTFGMRFDNNETAPAYQAARGLKEWTLNYIFEFPGYIRLSNTSSAPQMFGILTTPKLSAIVGSANLTVTFDGLRFASVGNIGVKVLGAGTITSASVVKDGAGAAISITPESDGKSFLITSEHGSKHANEVAKTFSNFRFVVQGATADTQICFDSTTAGSKSADGRYCLDNIVIKKN